MERGCEPDSHFKYFIGGSFSASSKAEIFLGKIPQITEQNRFAGLEASDFLLRRRTADVVNILHLTTEKRCQPLRMLKQRDEPLVVLRVALMGYDRHLGALLQQILKRGHTLIYPVRIPKPSCFFLHVAIDIHPHQDGFPGIIELRNGPYLREIIVIFPCPDRCCQSDSVGAVGLHVIAARNAVDGLGDGDAFLRNIDGEHDIRNPS
jgi:hypothetical protein